MKVSRFLPSDKHTFDAWLAERGRPPLHPDVLPEMGFMAHHEQGPAACCFVYQTDSEAGIMGWTTTSPDLNMTMRVKYRAVEALIEAVKDHARAMGWSFVFHFSSAHGLTSRLEEHGFHVSKLAHSICLWKVQDGD